MKQPGKNPYEIRLELLQLARNILQSQHESNKETISAPTSDEIVEEAERLNAFVSNTHHHS